MEIIYVMLLIIGSLLLLYIGYIFGKRIGLIISDRKWEKEIPSIRADATKRSRAVLSGQFSEQLAPFLPDFKWKPTEAKFLGKPIDFLVFKGMDSKEITEVVFVEVKSGKSRLSGVEKSLRDAIEKGNVRWEEYRISERLTKKT